MKKLAVSAVAGLIALSAASPGIRPRADAASYAAHQSQSDYSIGADLIPRDQVKKMFAADLNHAGYVVVEVGVFPADGKNVDLFPTDFRLFVGEGQASLRPVDSDTIAEILTGSHDAPARRNGPHDINTSTGIAIGHGTYTDPVTGRRVSTTATETTAGVGVGGPAPVPCRTVNCEDQPPPMPPQRPSIANSHAIGQELWQKSLPDGKTSTAVAGYLYFPKPPGKAKNNSWELRYEPASGSSRLPLAKP